MVGSVELLILLVFSLFYLAIPLKQSPCHWWSLPTVLAAHGPRLRRASSQRHADVCIVRSAIHQNHSD